MKQDRDYGLCCLFKKLDSRFFPKFIFHKDQMSKASDNKPTSATEEQDVVPKKNRHIITPLEEQQEKLNRLFQKIDKPVYIPERPVEKNELQAPKDFVRNVSGNKEK